MNRRDFIKLSLGAGASILFPQYAQASILDISKISFSAPSSNIQTIIVFLYGGASQLSANLTNFDEVNENSFTEYESHFGRITKTANSFWEQAGGDDLEVMVNNGDLSIFRSCYSEVRDKVSNRAHGLCINENQKGTFDTSDSSAGIISNLANILNYHGVVNENSLLPFITMEGDSIFYEDGVVPTPTYLKPVTINENLNINPYKRNIRTTNYYTDEELRNPNYYKSDSEGGFDPSLIAKIDKLTKEINTNKKIKEAFSKMDVLASFIEETKNIQTPDLGEEAYLSYDNFSQKMESAIKILYNNPDTKIITLGTAGLGGWDDHNDARNYVLRSKRLFQVLRSAVAHLKAINKINDVNIVVFSEFGRNVNLNASYGWDHGNLQNFYILGGKNYINHKGVVGETILDIESEWSRLWLKPKPNSYWFEPMSIASTIYKMYGIQNPEILTGGYGAIDIL